MGNQNADCSRAEDRAALEARFYRAKQALLSAQEQHCEAASEFLLARAEFLLARAQVRQLLEAVFPGQESGVMSTLWEEA